MCVPGGTSEEDKDGGGREDSLLHLQEPWVRFAPATTTTIITATADASTSA